MKLFQFYVYNTLESALECFSLSKQVMHTIPEECEYAVTWLH